MKTHVLLVLLLKLASKSQSQSQNGDSRPSFHTVSFTYNVLVLGLVPAPFEEVVFVPVM
jgi:hypothetical protein